MSLPSNSETIYSNNERQSSSDESIHESDLEFFDDFDVSSESNDESSDESDVSTGSSDKSDNFQDNKCTIFTYRVTYYFHVLGLVMNLINFKIINVLFSRIQ